MYTCIRNAVTERGAHADTKAAITYCKSVEDSVSREIPEDIPEDTEEHIDYLEAQFEQIEKVGIQNYPQTQMGAPSGS